MTSLPATSRAAALVAPGTVEVIDLPIPAKLEPGALLVLVDKATICGTDVHVRDGAVSQAASSASVRGRAPTRSASRSK